MKFVKYNLLKVIAIFAGISLFWMLLMDPWHAMLIAAFITAFISLLGANNFYVRERLLFGTPDNSVLEVFDNGVHEANMKYRNNLFVFAQPWLSGTISGYPVEVRIDPTRSGNFEIKFSVHKTQGIYAGHDRIEELAIPWDWRRRLTGVVKDEVDKFVAQLHARHDEVPEVIEDDVA